MNIIKYKLKLYVTGSTLSSQRAMDNLKKIMEDSPYANDYDLEIVDLVDRPQLAEDEKIIATPVLIKLLPPPVRKLIGDLSDKEKVLLGLDLISLSEEYK